MEGTTMPTLRIMRLAALCIIALVLWIKPTVIRAQYGSGCSKYSTTPQDCPSCCPLHPMPIDTIFVYEGPGVYGIGYQNLNCGSGTCQGAQCTQSLPVPVQNSPEYCAMFCSQDSDCCSGYMCFSGECV